ncbi:putative outer membrane starch-binding protein [Dinghuibacter silviterrae]|uniref:Putative outer membrane starch-binding protein n=2 Tax=Dinghuibacter silviterrae TaxID=1539049 RepID=A0A4R8DF57_9BACT|nr:putative outer membrane starch-binding protein [Dinghuibacter silviterrae]
MALLLGGCTKQLNQVPQSTASQQAIFGSVQGLQLYANSFYDQTLPSMDNIYKTDANMSDFGATNSCPTYLQQGAYSSRNATGWSWGPLRNINYFIQGLATSPVDSADKANFMGLARFFRAYFYFGMVQRYGDVPWINKPLDPSDSALYGARSPRNLVMDSVVADLQFACGHLSLQTDPTSSQITKWVAYGFLSRVCLFEGTFEKYLDTMYHLGNAQAYLQLAVTSAKAVMDSSGFALYNGAGTATSYRQLFISNTPIAKEVMLAEVASQSLAVLNDANWFYTSSTYGNRFSFIRTFINTYLNIDGTPFTNISGHDTLPFLKETQNRDLRLSQTIRTPGYTRTLNGATVPAPPVFSYTYTGYQPIKWCLDDEYYDNGANNTNSICLMRYAEILLNYAEAKEELNPGSLTATDWTNTVGALRARAGITGGLTTLPTTVDPYMQAHYYSDITDPVLMEIRRERGIELALEGFRFYDLVRWGHAGLLTGGWNGFYVPALNQPMDLNGDGIPDVYFYQGTPPSNQVSTITYINVAPTANGVVNPQILANGTSGELHWLDNVPRSWSSYQTLYPIPYSELLLNPNLVQNPGWQ